MNSKTALQQTLSLILISCFTLLSCNHENDENTYSFATNPKSGSGRITKAHSDSLRSDYRDDRKHLKTIDNNKTVALEGFVFDAD